MHHPTEPNEPGPDEPGPDDPESGQPTEPIEMSEDEFDQAVTDALAQVPDDLAARLENVVVFVEDEYQPQPWEDPNTELLGLYDGIPLTERAEATWQLPDRIIIFRGPLMRMCHDRDHLVDEITVTVVHEVAHFFGIDDEALHRLGWG